ncbi:coenzyme F420 hydrogenase subunit beta [Paraburkholderia aspalathi]|uniref:Coenzyme F420 hydrogenase subunit beta n=1 Tax=Paraburkholderia aspalathi TaxID=1324617 RepID=A0A1I7E810_9BURK|nr:coenzyme F420 hydrogenase subunit beta [Paraburkholderia aspalathi]
MVKSGLLESVLESNSCTGCGLCESALDSNPVRMQMSGNGFLRPVIIKPLTRDDEDKLASFCPGVVVSHQKTEGQFHPIWGPLVETRVGHSCDEEIRRVGSSGGVLSGLLLHLLESGSVDFVAQIAVSIPDPLANELQISRTRADVLRAAGSRYAPSAPLKDIRSILDGEETGAFVGKPCDVVALRQLARVDERVGKRFRYFISFMCAGVPSQNGTYEVLKQLDMTKDEVGSFRYRGNGWPGNVRAVSKSGDVREMDYSKSWGTILNRFLQFRCKICPDGTGEFADIVCADAWYGKDGYPDFSDRDGRSLILIRTDVGRQLMERATQAGALCSDAISVGEIESMQPYQSERKRFALARLIGAQLAFGHAPRVRRLGLVKASQSSNMFSLLKNCVGTYRRAKNEN